MTLATHYVTAIRHGAVPDVDDAFSAAAKIENSRIEKEALEIYHNQMETIILPVPSKVLEKCYMKAQQIALDYLRKNVVHDKDGQCENSAQMEMDNHWNQLKDENAQKVQDMCDVNIQHAYKQSMEQNIENKIYEVSGGHRMFQRDIEKMKREFMSSLRDFEDNEILMTWLEFMKTIEESETMIIESDDALSAKEKRSSYKMLKEQKQHELDVLEKQRIEMEKHFNKLEDDRKKQEEKYMAKFKELVQAKVEKEQADRELKETKAKLEEEEKKRKLKQAEETKRKEQDEKARKRRKTKQKEEKRKIEADRKKMLQQKDREIRNLKAQNEQTDKELKERKAKEEERKKSGIITRVVDAVIDAVKND